jgi:hypothetical protein
VAKFNDGNQKEALQESGEEIKPRSLDQKILVVSDQRKGNKATNAERPGK